MLRLALASFAALYLCAALLLAWRVLDASPARGLSGGFLLPHLIVPACLLAAAAARCAMGTGAMTRGIDISGLGEIRLTVQQSMGSAQARTIRVQLMPGSTLWPRCLLLLLRPEQGGPVRVLPVLPDSIAPDQFRALAVALRAIAGRDNKFVRKNKIL